MWMRIIRLMRSWVRSIVALPAIGRSWRNWPTVKAVRYASRRIRLADGGLLLVGGAALASGFTKIRVVGVSPETAPLGRDAVRPSARSVSGKGMKPRAAARWSNGMSAVSARVDLTSDTKRREECIITGHWATWILRSRIIMTSWPVVFSDGQT